MALYPVSVHTYTPHRDQVDYVLADHVNSLQDEVTAIETTVGPGVTTWTYTGDANFQNLGDLSTKTAWTTVKDRLDALQAHVVRLERATGVLITTLPAQINGPGPILPRPVVTVRNIGQTLPASSVQWTSYAMSVADFDSDGAFVGGSSLVCPQTGWWSISATAWTDLPALTTGTHTVSNRLVLGTSEVAAHTSTLDMGGGGQHRVNVTYDGPWLSGQPLYVQGQQLPVAGTPSVASRMLVSATYVRETS